MPAETYTGRLNNDGPQVSIENGPILAIQGPDPCATAAREYARFGETQPVTVTGTRGKVDNISVLYVASIAWAAQAPVAATPADDLAQGGVLSVEDGDALVKPPAGLKTAKKAAARKSARTRS